MVSGGTCRNEIRPSHTSGSSSSCRATRHYNSRNNNTNTRSRSENNLSSPGLLRRINLVASSRRTLYTMGSFVILVLLGLSVGIATTTHMTDDLGTASEAEAESPIRARSSAPKFNKFVAVEDELLAEGQSGPHPSSVVKRTPQLSSFSLNDIVDNNYRAERWNGTWVSDTEYAYRNREGSLALLSVVTGQSRILVPADVMDKPARVFKFWPSPDLKYVLLAFRPQKLFRHSFIAAYDVYNVETGDRIKLQPSEATLRRLAPPGGPGGPGGPPGGGPPQGGPPGGGGGPGGGRPPPDFQLPLMLAQWAPTGSSLAYVFSNNIFYRATPEGTDVPITDSGE